MVCSTLSLGKLGSLSKSVNNSELNVNTVLLFRQTSTAIQYLFQEVSEDSPELHSDGIFVFHNPNVRNKLPIDLFEDHCITQVIRDDGLVSFGHSPYLLKVQRAVISTGRT
jgi:hypothetical protein